MTEKAIAYAGSRTFVVADVEREPLGPDDVEVAIAYTGICGTDLHIFQGHLDARVDPPQTIGHECSGVVRSVGTGVAGWAPGDQVVVFPVESCGICPTCKAGHPQVCPSLRILGIDRPGSQRTSWVVPAHQLLRVPASVPLQHAALAEPTAVAVHDVARAGVVADERILVVGGGPVGILIALIAQLRGARVVLVEISPHRREFARGVGLDAVSPDQFVETRGGSFDASFEVTGVQAGLDTALDGLSPRGRLVVVGIHAEPRQIDLNSIFQREIDIHGARLYSRDDFELAIQLIAEGALDPTPLISRVMPLDQAEGAFDDLLSGAPLMKVLLES